MQEEIGISATHWILTLRLAITGKLIVIILNHGTMESMS